MNQPKFLPTIKTFLLLPSAKGLFIKYVFFAGIATLVDIGFLYIFVEYFKVWYFYAAIFSYFLGMFTNYLLNKFLNFQNKSSKVIQQFGLFALVALIGLGLNQFILYALVEWFLVSYILAKVIAVFFVMFWSFFGHKKLTFKVFQ